jgi:hypothetical protein
MEALAQDGEQWVNYLYKYSESVQDLMTLTRNKGRFYSQPPENTENGSKRDILVVKTGFPHLHLPQS